MVHRGHAYNGCVCGSSGLERHIGSVKLSVVFRPAVGHDVIVGIISKCNILQQSCSAGAGPPHQITCDKLSKV